ncbi:MAG: EF-hand domain-containing protein [Lentisphaerae bacterium]|nr:EF-hand domain-containing protein [Lentisphaerota bacterium]
MRNRNIRSGSMMIVTATLVFAWAGAAVACDDGERPREGGFMSHDEDGDGVVSREEFPGPDERFDRLDTNGDGGIDKSEAPKGPPPGRDDDQDGSGQRDGSKFVDRLDKDGDGKISKDEFDGPDGHFDRFDRDGDGYINEDEAPTGPPPGRRGGRQAGSGGRNEAE